MIKLTAMDKSEQHNDETQTREGFSKLMERDLQPMQPDRFAPENWTHLRPKIGQICDHKNL